MARPLRVEFDATCCHVINRGNFVSRCRWQFQYHETANPYMLLLELTPPDLLNLNNLQFINIHFSTGMKIHHLKQYFS